MIALLFALSIFGIPHVKHEINTNLWSRCQVSNTFEKSTLFTDLQNQTVEIFDVDNFFSFNMYLLSNATFNMIYSLSCLNVSCPWVSLPCARSVFQISANGPAMPNIFIQNYDGANSSFQIIDNLLRFTIQF